jgi:hypothetical protein
MTDGAACTCRLCGHSWVGEVEDCRACGAEQVMYDPLISGSEMRKVLEGHYADLAALANHDPNTGVQWVPLETVATVLGIRGRAKGGGS